MPQVQAGQHNVRRIQAANACGCADPALNVGVCIVPSKTALGRGEWTVTMTNKEPFPIFVTLASGEGPDCAPKDFDTHVRDLEIAPGESASIKLARCGNGVEHDAPYRLTGRNKCNAVVGELSGSFPARV